MITILTKEYTLLGGWNETNEVKVNEETAISIAAKAMIGNANLSVSPEVWAKRKIEEGKDFKIFKTENTTLHFCF